MKTLTAILKSVKIYIIVGAVFLVVGLFAGAKVKEGHRLTKWVTNTVTNQGNTLSVPGLYTLTNGVTNRTTMTNIVTLYNFDSNMSEDPFVFKQSMDVLDVSLYTRHASTKLRPWIAENGYFVGCGAVEVLQSGDFLSNLIPEAVGGINATWGGVEGQIGFNGSRGLIGADAYLRF